MLGMGDKAVTPDRHEYCPHPLQDWSNRRAETDKSKQVMVSLRSPPWQVLYPLRLGKASLF